MLDLFPGQQQFTRIVLTKLKVAVFTASVKAGAYWGIKKIFKIFCRIDTSTWNQSRSLRCSLCGWDEITSVCVCVMDCVSVFV